MPEYEKPDTYDKLTVYGVIAFVAPITVLTFAYLTPLLLSTMSDLFANQSYLSLIVGGSIYASLLIATCISLVLCWKLHKVIVYAENGKPISSVF